MNLEKTRNIMKNLSRLYVTILDVTLRQVFLNLSLLLIPYFCYLTFYYA